MLCLHHAGHQKPACLITASAYRSPSQLGSAKQLHCVCHCTSWWWTLPEASPLGSSQGKRVVCGSHGKPPHLHRELKIGMLLEMLCWPFTAALGLGCHHHPRGQLASWQLCSRPGRAEKLILAVNHREDSFAFRSLLLFFTLGSHMLPCRTSPIPNIAHPIAAYSSATFPGCSPCSPVSRLGFAALRRCYRSP